MKQFYTVVLDRFTTFFSGKFATEPYETGWADEAIIFIRVHEISTNATISGTAQISIDGIVWVDNDGDKFGGINKPGDYYIKAKHFGGWLRLAAEITPGASCKATISMVLKG